MNQLTVLSDSDIEKMAQKMAELGAKIALEQFTALYFPKNTEIDEKFTAADLAEYLGVKKSTVLRYKRNRVIPFYKAGRSFYFKKSEVELALSSRTTIKKFKKGGLPNG